MIFQDDRKNRRKVLRALTVVFIVLVILITYNISLNISTARGNEVNVTSDYYYDNQHGKKKLVLTFDDGPDKVYTKQIIDILNEYNVPAAFFFTGNKVINNTDIVKLVHDEGHEIGVHTFTHSQKSHDSEARLKWELNSTNKLIESITGEPTIYYRPPYLIDVGTYPTFSKDNQATSLTWVKESGYIIVGADIISKDYELDNSIDVAKNIFNGVENGKHIILMHDGGGDRKVTIDTLPYIITKLQSEGYEFVTVANILGIDGSVELSNYLEVGFVDADTNGEVTMLQKFLRKEGYLAYKNVNGVFGTETRNALIEWKLDRNLITEAQKEADAYEIGVVDQSTRDRILERSIVFSGGILTDNIKRLEAVGFFQKILNKVYVTVINAVGTFLGLLFFVVIILGVLRVLIILTLFAYSNLKRKTNLNYRKNVSVVIAAYNEEKNIAATIESVLNSSHRPNEVIIIDDGSSDSTANIVREMQEKHGSVVVLRTITNGGKANAMNIGFDIATNDVVITIDGDTALDPDAIENLIKHFEDKRVWAVAGKVEVTKPMKLLGVFQAIEYTVGQNIDKEALNGINGVNVVPGAIGAWRKEKIVELGGHSTDTLVEDQDLTISILRNGGKVVYENSAIAYTETPSTLNGFIKQRFRWIFGTIQGVWKHKKGLFDGKGTSLRIIVIPNVVIYGIIMPLMYPLIDLILIVQLFTGNFKAVILSYLIFTLLDFLYTLIAFSNEKGKRHLLLALPLQRIFYRQLISLVVIFSIIKAIEGTKALWNKVDRTGSTQSFYDGLVSEVYS